MRLAKGGKYKETTSSTGMEIEGVATSKSIFDLSKNFELDYWGVSGRDLAKNISILNNNFSLAWKPARVSFIW